MRIWRLARGVYDPLSGEGARLHGGRWNPAGWPVAYCAGSLSLAVLELLVHADPEDLPEDLTAFAVEVPDDLLIETVSTGDLPGGWNEAVEAPACRRIGQEWLRAGSSALLRVPSAVVPQEVNYLVSPACEAAGRLRVTEQAPFRFDPRLPGFRKG